MDRPLRSGSRPGRSGRWALLPRSTGASTRTTTIVLPRAHRSNPFYRRSHPIHGGDCFEYARGGGVHIRTATLLSDLVFETNFVSNRKGEKTVPRVEWNRSHAKNDLKAITKLLGAEIKRAHMACINSKVSNLPWGETSIAGRCRFFEFYLLISNEKRKKSGAAAAMSSASAALDSTMGILAPATGLGEIASMLYKAESRMYDAHHAGASSLSHDEEQWGRSMRSAGEVAGYVAVGYEELMHPEFVNFYMRNWSSSLGRAFDEFQDSPSATARQDTLRMSKYKYMKHIRSGGFTKK